jgi:GrpB-like predicted nucleotidyltransferase (UPF0157 family)
VTKAQPQVPQGAQESRERIPRSRGLRFLFHEEQHTIRRRLGRANAATEHIGSSSVAGLVGRAEIDILVGVLRNVEVPPCVRALQPLNYGIVSQSQSPNEAWAHLTRMGAVQFDVLVVRHLGPLWRRHLALREYLRADPARAAAYGHLKVEWAASYGAGTASYKEAKRRYWNAIATP